MIVIEVEVYDWPDDAADVWVTARCDTCSIVVAELPLRFTADDIGRLAADHDRTMHRAA